MAKVKTYREILNFFDGVGLYSVPIPIAGSPFSASPFPYLLIDGAYYSFRRCGDFEEIYEEEYRDYCEWANEKLARQQKNGVRVVYHKNMLRLIKDDQHQAEICPEGRCSN